VADLKKGARITGNRRDKLAADLVKKYQKGASIRALAESSGRSYGFVRRVLTEAGVEVRGRRGAVRTSGRQPREDAHRLVDALPDDRVPAVVALLRREVDQAELHSVRRRFRTVGVFEGDPDLGVRAKELARQELGGTSSKTA
jgi:hypothetical protein